MPDFLRWIRNRRNLLSELGFDVFDRIAYEFLYLVSPSRSDLFFNGGYLPFDRDFRTGLVSASEAHCAMMYHFVAKTHVGQSDDPPAHVLDVGCGQGGGMLYLAHLFPKARVVGTDRSLAAVQRARQTLKGCEQTEVIWQSGFCPGPFDLVVGVGTPTYIGLPQFLEQCARVLSPGGIVSISGGYRKGSHDAVRHRLRHGANLVGLTLESYRDITPNTYAALEADIPRREAALERVPWPFRGFGRRWADLPGSKEYDEYRAGSRVDFAAVLRSGSEASRRDV